MWGSLVVAWALVALGQNPAGAGAGAGAGIRAPELEAGDAARVRTALRAPVGVDPAGYVAMLEMLALGDTTGLGRLIGEQRGFLVSAESRVEIVEVGGTTARVRVLGGVNQAEREGYVGVRWLERLPETAQGDRVDPKIQALAELKAKRTNAEQRILADVYQELMSRPRPTTTTKRVSQRPVLPGPTAGAGDVPAAGATAGEVPAPAPAAAALPVVAPAATGAAPVASPPPVPVAAPAAAPAVPATAPAVSAASGAPAPPATKERRGHLCGAPTKSGEPCRRYVVNGKFCYQHGG